MRAQRIGFRMMVFLVALCGCTADSLPAARTAAEAALACGGDDLRVKPLGELVLRPSRPIELALHDAAGCSSQTAVFCLEGRCAIDPAALLGEELAATARRGFELRRTASRARCDPAGLRVLQESESLWIYQACDGSWDYHCRARGCQSLRPR